MKPKVREAVIRFENKPKVADWRSYPVKPSPVASDAAIRKELRAHGSVCRGFGYYHFHQND